MTRVTQVVWSKTGDQGDPVTQVTWWSGVTQVTSDPGDPMVWSVTNDPGDRVLGEVWVA